MQIFYKESCNYRIGSLKDEFYLYDFDTTECFVDDELCWSVVGDAETVKVGSISFSEEVQLDNSARYYSKKELKISIDAYKPSEMIRFLEHLLEKDYKIVFADKQGNYFIFNTEFGFKTEFSLLVGDNIEITLTCSENHPCFNLAYYEKHDGKVWFDNCSFAMGNLDNLYVNESDTVKVKHSGSIINEIVTRYGLVDLNEWEYLESTLSVNVEYVDGLFNNTVTFSLALDDNHPELRYNLLYFKNNIYTTVIKVGDEAVALENLIPNYSIETSEEVTTPNLITITLKSTTDTIIPFMEDFNVTANEKIIWVPVERFRKGGIWVETEECIGYPSRFARRLLLMAQSITGNQIGKYLCHISMLDYYTSLGLEIIGTYTDSDTIDGVDILFVSDLCYRELPELCKFYEFLENYTFTKTGETIFADVECTCDWKITNIPDWLIFSQTSGLGGQRYTIRITCNVVDREWMTFDSYVTITTADTISKVRYQYSPENWMEGCSWLNTSFNNNVYAEETAVKVYITNPNVRSSMIEIEGDTSEWDEAVNWFVYDDYILFKFSRYEGFEWHNIVITVNVAQHSESNCELVFHRNPKEEIAVPTDGTICQDGNLYGRKAVYYRYSPDGEAEFSHYEASNLIRENAVECSETIYVRWVEVPNEGVCELGAYYAIEYQEVSTDQITWTRSGEYRKGRVLDSDSRTCQTEPTYSEWRESDKTVCENGNLYGIDYHWLSDDGVHWYIDWGTSQRGRLLESNSAECGYVPPIQQIEEWRETVGYICEEEIVYPPYSILYSTNDGTNYVVSNGFYINGKSSLLFGDIYPNMTDELFTFDVGDGLVSLEQFLRESSINSYLHITSLKFVGEWDTSKLRTMYNMFNTTIELKNITFPKDFNTENVTDMRQMFSDCESLEKLDLSGWNVSKVTSVNGMFQDCRDIKEINLSGWDLSNAISVQSMKYMFLRCKNLSKLNLTGVKTDNVTDMGYMFSECSSIQELDLSSFKTDNVKSINSMFSECSSIQELDLSNFNVGNVTRISSMFKNCYSLKQLDLSGWKLKEDISSSGISNMFQGCTSLKTIKCTQAFKDWCITNKETIALDNADTINWIITD